LEVLFTSLVGGDGLRRRLLALVDDVAALATSRRVDVHVMTFAFTDREIAGALADAAVRAPKMTVRVLADWSQRVPRQGQQVSRLAGLGLPNLRVRYTLDQPYTWDAAAARLCWSYRESRGLLHHKTLGVFVDGRPWALACGSFNWTANAARSYEHALIVTGTDAPSHDLMARVELEFEALWSDGRVTCSPEEASQHYQAIREEYRLDPALSPSSVVGRARGADDPLQVLDPVAFPAGGCDERLQVFTAFSARLPDGGGGQAGHAEINRTQRILMHRPSGVRKGVPLTLTTLALDAIFGAEAGDTLKVAMYGLSTRVPEYGALLGAARRGVHVCILLDGDVGDRVIERLADVRRREGLPIEVRAGRRMMHQKYVLHPRSATVLTGTANMTTDASARHWEHRILIRGHEPLAAQFGEDFDVIWSRLASGS
jgi:phosphatidylserine/phosphatidylglycerophosphate/cardiolipin synthase-like enzyme